METAQSNGQTSAPEQTAAPEQQAQGNQLPTLDEVINSFNNNPDGIESQTTNPEQPIQDVQQDLEQAQSQETPEAAQFEQLKKQELELWKERKEFKEEREAWKRERSEQSENYSGFEETLNNLLQTDEEKAAANEPEAFDPEEYKASLREEILNEVNGQRESEKAEQENKQIVDNFVQEARDFTQERADSFPMLEGMGKHDLVYEAMEATFNENAEAYGDEKAAEMMPTMEQVATHVEKYLANELQQVLKSDLVRGAVQKMLGMKSSNPENQTQSNISHQSQGQNTLTNSSHTQHSAGGKDTAQMNDQEALEYALSFVTK